MSERNDLPKIKPDEAPSIINYEAGAGAFLGNLLGALATPALPEKYRWPVILGGTALGAIIGGSKGKQQQEKEAVSGRVVKDPGYWNKGILSGLMVGEAIILPLRYLTKKRLLFVGAAIELVAMTIGASMRKNSLQHDFDKAVALRDKEQAQLKEMVASVAKQGPQQQQSYKNSVTADESAELEAKQKPASSHIDRQAQADVAQQTPAQVA